MQFTLVILLSGTEINNWSIFVSTLERKKREKKDYFLGLFFAFFPLLDDEMNGSLENIGNDDEDVKGILKVTYAWNIGYRNYVQLEF